MSLKFLKLLLLNLKLKKNVLFGILVLFILGGLIVLNPYHIFYKTALSPLGNDAKCVRYSGFPSTIQVNQNFEVSLTMKNTGSTPWVLTQGFRLGSKDPENNTLWGQNRILMNPNDSPVEPGEEVTFSTTLTAPASPGTYSSKWQMLQENVEWFGEKCGPDAIQVTTPSAGSPIGNFGSAFCTELLGWAGDKDNIDTPVTVEFYDGPKGNGGILLGTTLANLSATDSAAICQALGGTNCNECNTNTNLPKCKHRFRFETPPSLRDDGKTHNIYVYALNLAGTPGSDALIANSPRILKCGPTTTCSANGQFKVTVLSGKEDVNRCEDTPPISKSGSRYITYTMFIENHSLDTYEVDKALFVCPNRTGEQYCKYCSVEYRDPNNTGWEKISGEETYPPCTAGYLVYRFDTLAHDCGTLQYDAFYYKQGELEKKKFTIFIGQRVNYEEECLLPTPTPTPPETPTPPPSPIILPQTGLEPLNNQMSRKTLIIIDLIFVLLIVLIIKLIKMFYSK